jgi:hypothetical protein
MATETQDKKTLKKVSILINKEHFFIESPIAGSELRALGKIPAENQLFREVPGDAPDELIRDEQTYEVKPGTRFYDLPRGTVGAAALDAQLAYAAERLPSASVARQPDGIHALRWRTRLAGPWSPSEVDLIVLLPPQYPAQAPSGFDAVGDLKVNGGGVGGAGAREIVGEKCTHLCWNPAGAIDYTADDGVWRFAKFSETRFLTLQ